jgi:HlyD family secretion protein
MKKRLIIILVIILVVIVGIIVISGLLAKKSADLTNVTVAKKGDLTEIVSVTGKVKAKESVSLAFERSGRVNRVFVTEGDRVEIGQKLIELDQSELLAQLRDARASLEAERAKFDEIKAGPRPEEIAVKKAELKKAEQDLANYYASVSDSLNGAYIKASDAVISKTDNLFIDDSTQNPKLSFAISNSVIENDMRSLRLASTNELEAWKGELTTLSATSPAVTIKAALKEGQRRSTIVDNLLKKSLESLDDKSVSLSTAAIQAYRTDLNTGRANVNLGLTDLNTKDQAITAQGLVVNRINQELNLILAGSAKEQIDAQAARVGQAEAKAQLIEAQIQKASLKSPLKGVVTKQDGKVGEIAAAGAPIVSVMSEENLEIEANVPEVDIAKVKVNNFAKTTIDAYGSDTYFDAKVITIDPAETVVEGVSTYKVTLTFVNKDDRLKSGMTANIDIVTGERQGIVKVPQRLVIGRNGEKFVQVLGSDNKIAERKVTTGLKGSDGDVEILSGLSEGEKVMTPSSS